MLISAKIMMIKTLTVLEEMMPIICDKMHSLSIFKGYVQAEECAIHSLSDLEPQDQHRKPITNI